MTGIGHLNATDSHVARRIRGKRLALGLTESDLASALGVARTQILEYEQAAARVPPDHLHRLSEFLDVPVGYFLPSPASA